MVQGTATSPPLPPWLVAAKSNALSLCCPSAASASPSILSLEMPSVLAPSRARDLALLWGMLPLPRGTSLGSRPDRSRAGQAATGCSPGWQGILTTYSTFFMPLSNSLHGTKALRFFLCLCPFGPLVHPGAAVGAVASEAAFAGAVGAAAGLVGRVAERLQGCLGTGKHWLRKVLVWS